MITASFTESLPDPITKCLGNSADTIRKIVGLALKVRNLFPLITGDLYRRVRSGESLSNTCSILRRLMNYALKITYMGSQKHERKLHLIWD